MTFKLWQSRHPSDAMLEEYLLLTLSATAHFQCDQHIIGCSKCHDRLEQALAFITALRQAVTLATNDQTEPANVSFETEDHMVLATSA
jgi:hypothetical protein